ncbi:hypothetical protein LRS14_06665 [Aquincola sp. J276]|nr:hypothetical protein [Aquincola sp. J276]MCR5864931.1 hypothetical protein [Aquincola sp. J276]
MEEAVEPGADARAGEVDGRGAARAVLRQHLHEAGTQAGTRRIGADGAHVHRDRRVAVAEAAFQRVGRGVEQRELQAGRGAHGAEGLVVVPKPCADHAARIGAQAAGSDAHQVGRHAVHRHGGAVDRHRLVADAQVLPGQRDDRLPRRQRQVVGVARRVGLPGTAEAGGRQRGLVGAQGRQPAAQVVGHLPQADGAAGRRQQQQAGVGGARDAAAFGLHDDVAGEMQAAAGGIDHAHGHIGRRIAGRGMRHQRQLGSALQRPGADEREQSAVHAAAAGGQAQVAQHQVGMNAGRVGAGQLQRSRVDRQRLRGAGVPAVACRGGGDGTARGQADGAGGRDGDRRCVGLVAAGGDGAGQRDGALRVDGLQRLRPAELQRSPGRDGQRRAVGQALAAHRLQQAGLHRGAAAVDARATQHQRALAGLEQDAAAVAVGHDAVVAERLAGGDVERAPAALQCQAAVGGQRHAAADAQRAAVQQQVRRAGAAGRGAQVAVAADGQHAAQHLRRAGVAVVGAAGQGERAAAGLGQATVALDAAAEQVVGGIRAGEQAAGDAQAGAAVGRLAGPVVEAGHGLGTAQPQHGAIGDLHPRGIGQAVGGVGGQRAGLHQREAGVGLRTRKREAPAAQLREAAHTVQAAAEDGVGGIAGGQRVGAQRHLGAAVGRQAGQVGQRGDGLVAAQHQDGAVGQLQRAGVGQALRRASGQGAGLDAGEAGMAVGAGQQQGAAAGLGEAAGAAAVGGAAFIGQRLAGGHVDGAAGALQGDDPPRGQREAVVHPQAAAVQQQACAGHAQLRVGRQPQHAAQHRGAAVAVGPRLRQREHAAALLDQPPGAAAAHQLPRVDGAVGIAQRQRVGAQQQPGAAVGHLPIGIGERGDRLRPAQGQHRAVGDLQRAAVVQVAGAAAFGGQGAGRHQRQPGVAVQAGQREAATARLGEAARAVDHAAEAGVAGIARGQREAAQQHPCAAVGHLAGCVGQRADGLVAAQLQLRAVGHLHCAGVVQALGALRGQHAGGHQCQAGVGVGTGQRQRAAAGLRQAAAAADVVGHQQRVAALEAQQALVEHAAAAQAAGAAAIADLQHAGRDGRRAAVAAVAGERQQVGACLGESAGADDAAAEGGAAAQRQRVAAQVHAAACGAAASQAAERLVVGQHQRGAGRIGQLHRRAVGKRRAAGQREAAGQHRGEAGVAVAAAEGEHAAALLRERAAAVDAAADGQCSAAVEHQRALVEHVAAAQRAGAAALPHLQRGAGLHGGEPAIGVVAGEDQAARARLRERAAAGDGVGHHMAGRIAAVEHQRRVVPDRPAAQAAGGAAIAHLQRAVGHGDAARHAVVARQREAAAAQLDQLHGARRTGAAGDAAGEHRGGVVAAQGQPAVQAQRHRGAGRAAQRSDGLVRIQHQCGTGIQLHRRGVRQCIAAQQPQGAALHRGQAAVAVAAGQRELAGAGLRQAAAAADRHAQHQRAAALHHQQAVVDDGAAARRAGAAAAAQPQHAAAVNGGAAAVAVVGRQRQAAAARLAQRAGAGNGVGHRERRTAVEHQAALVDHRAAAQRAGGATGAHLQRAAGVDGGAAAVAVVGAQDQQAAAGLHQRAGAGHSTGQREGRAAVEHQAAVVGDATAAQRAGAATRAHAQRAAGVDGGAQVGVVGGEREQAAAGLREAAVALQQAGQGEVGAPVHHQGTVEVDGPAARRAAGAAVAQLQRAAGVDGGAAAVAVVGGQREQAGACLPQGAAAADGVGQRDGIAAVDDQRAVVGDGAAGHRAGGAAVAQLQAAAGRDAGAARIAVAAGQREVAAALLDELQRVGHRHAAGDAAAEQRAGVVAAGAQRLVGGQGHGARAGQRADRLAGVDGQRGAGIHLHRAAVADGAAALQRQAAGAAHGGGAAVAVAARQGEQPGARLRQRSAAADGIAHRQRIAAVEHQRTVVDHRAAAQRAGGAAVAHLQRAAGLHRGAAGIAVVRGQHQRAAAGLPQPAAAVDGGGLHDGVAAVEHQGAVVADGARTQRAGRAAVAHLQRGATGDGGAAGMAVVGGQHHGTGAVGGQAAAAADGAAHRDAAAAVEHQAAIVHHPGRAQAARSAAIAHLQAAPAVDGGAAAVAVVGGQREQAGACLPQGAAAADGVGQRDGIAAVDDQRAVVGDGAAGHRAGGAAVAQLQAAAGRDAGAARIAVAAGQREVAAALLDELQRVGHRHAAGDAAAEQRAGVVAAGAQRLVGGQGHGARAGQRADRLAGVDGQRGAGIHLHRAAVADGAAALQRQAAGAAHGGGAAVAVAARQGEQPCARLRQRSAAADGIAHRQRIAAVEHQRTVVDHRAAAQRAGGAAVAHLQRVAGVDGEAAEAVGAGEHQAAAAGLGERAGTAERCGDGGGTAERPDARVHQRGRAVQHQAGGADVGAQLMRRAADALGDGDGAGCRHRGAQRHPAGTTGRPAGIVGGQGEVGARTGHRDRGGHIDVVARLQRERRAVGGGDGAVDEQVVGRLQRDRAGAELRLHRAGADAAVGAGVGKSQRGAAEVFADTVVVHIGRGQIVDGDVGRVQQQPAAAALRGQQVRAAPVVQEPLAGHLHLPAIAACLATARSDAALVARGLVRPHHHRAAIAAAPGAGVDLRAGGHGRHARIGLRTLALPVPAHQHGAAARVAACIDAGGARKQQLLAQQFGLPALLARLLAADVDGAGHGGDAVGAAVDHHPPLALTDASGAHDAVHVQHRVGKAAAGHGARLHAAAIGQHIAQHRQPRGQVFVSHVEEDEAVALHVHLHRAGRRQAHPGAADVAALHQRRPYQRHGAAGADVAFGPQLARLVQATGELVAAIGQRLWIEVQRGGHEAAHVHLRAGTEQDAARVGQEHPAIGLQLPQDHAGLGAHHAVEQDGRGAGLLHLHPLAGADGEALPVDAGLAGGLADDQLPALRRAHLHLAGSHLRASGQRLHRQRTGRQRGGQAHRLQRHGQRPRGTPQDRPMVWVGAFTHGITPRAAAGGRHPVQNSLLNCRYRRGSRSRASARGVPTSGLARLARSA